jgi:hypothetical protein
LGHQRKGSAGLVSPARPIKGQSRKATKGSIEGQTVKAKGHIAGTVRSHRKQWLCIATRTHRDLIGCKVFMSEITASSKGLAVTSFFLS